MIDTVSQIFLLISFLMTVIMLGVLASFTHQKAMLRTKYTQLIWLASTSFGIFFSMALDEIINYGRPYHPNFVIACSITLGFLLAVVTGVLYIRLRASYRRRDAHEHIAELQQTRNR